MNPGLSLSLARIEELKMTKKQDWERRFENLFAEVCGSKEYHDVLYYDEEACDTLKDFIAEEIERVREELRKKIEGIERMRRLHPHDSIPSYTANLENGCVACVRNQVLDDVRSLLSKEDEERK